MVKLASNENCFGPSPMALEAMQKSARDMHLYPNDGRHAFKEAICGHHADKNIHPDQIVLGNGSNELITLLIRGLVGPGEALLNAWPSFICYRLANAAQGRKEVTVVLDDSHGYDLDAMARSISDGGCPIKLVFIANPNNPTGKFVTKGELADFLGHIPHETVVILDEAYADYVVDPAYPDGLSLIHNRPRTGILRTFSKSHGLAGLRIGYFVGDPDIAKILHRIRDPFNLNGMALAAGPAALNDVEHVRKARENNLSELPRLTKSLTELGFDVLPSIANFVMATSGEGMVGMDKIIQSLLEKGVIIRPITNYDRANSARISVGTPQENAYLITALRGILHT